MKNKFIQAYYKDIITESDASNEYGLCDFQFPKYTFRNIEVGDKLIHIWTSNRGESGNWRYFTLDSFCERSRSNRSY